MTAQSTARVQTPASQVAPSKAPEVAPTASIDAGDESISPAPKASRSGQGSSPTSPDPKAAKQKAAVQSLGQVKRLDGGFYSAAGGVVDSLVPNKGDKGKLQLAVNVPVEQSGTVKINFEFIGSAERSDDGVKLRVQLGGGVVVSKEVKVNLGIYKATVEAYAQAKLFGYMEAQGDSGAEAFRLLGLGIQQRMAAVSKTVADAVFNGQFVQDTVQGMDSNDYVETGVGASVTAGFKGSAKPKGSGKKTPGVETQGSAGIEGQTGTRIEADHGKLEKTDVRQVAIPLNFAWRNNNYGVTVTAKWRGKKFDAIEVEAAGDIMIDVKSMTAGNAFASLISGFVSQIKAIIDKSSGMMPDAEAGRQAGAMARLLGLSIGGDVVMAGATRKALAKLSKFNAIKLGHKLTFKGAYGPSAGLSGEIILERSSSVEFGDSPRDTVYVALENIQQIFRIPLGGGGKK